MSIVDGMITIITDICCIDLNFSSIILFRKIV